VVPKSKAMDLIIARLDIMARYLGLINQLEGIQKKI